MGNGVAGVRDQGGRRITRNERGQATIEFALTMILILGYGFFFIQLSLAFAWGNYIQYATFMSARAFLSSGPSEQDQAERARTVILQTLKMGDATKDRLPSVAIGIEGEDRFGSGVAGFSVDPPPEPQFIRDNRASSWNEGIRYTFRSRIFMMPLKGSGDSPSRNANTVTLTAESILGREPSYQECIQYMSQYGAVGTGVLIDNGC